MRAGRRDISISIWRTLLAASAIAAEMLIEDHFAQDVGLQLFKGARRLFCYKRRSVWHEIFFEEFAR